MLDLPPDIETNVRDDAREGVSIHELMACTLMAAKHGRANGERLLFPNTLHNSTNVIAVHDPL